MPPVYSHLVTLEEDEVEEAAEAEAAVVPDTFAGACPTRAPLLLKV